MRGQGPAQSHQAEIPAVGVRKTDGRIGSRSCGPDCSILRISPGAVLGNRACRESSCASATNPGSHSFTSAPFGAIRYIALQCGKGRWGNCR